MWLHHVDVKWKNRKDWEVLTKDRTQKNPRHLDDGMLVRTEPRFEDLKRGRNMDYEGPVTLAAFLCEQATSEDITHLFNLHPTALQDAELMEGLPKKVSSNVPRRLSD